MKERNLSLTVEEYNELIKSVQEFCKKLWKQEGYPYINNIVVPDNLWDEYEETVRKYVKFVLNDLYGRFWEEDFVLDNRYEILPDWYFAPRVSLGNIFWRMGPGQTYNIILYNMYLNSLSEEDQKKWEEKYPEPDFYNQEYLEEHSDELIHKENSKKVFQKGNLTYVVEEKSNGKFGY